MSDLPAKQSTIKRGVLADRLIGVVDGVRRKIHEKLGTRPWQVDIVTRIWSGNERGVGHATQTVLTLDPIPKVVRSTHDRMGPAGREAAGSVVISQVSLRYAQSELAPKVDARTEVAYRLTELHGTRQKVTWLVLSADPVPRRGDKAGDETDWYLVLNETSAMGPMDGVDAP